MWSLTEGALLIGALRGQLEGAGFCLGLTGSVLFKGSSDKDLDLVLYPMNEVKPDYRKALAVFRAYQPGCFILAVNHEIDAKLVFTLRLKDKRRIDLFFPGYTYAERNDEFSTAGEAVGSGAGDDLNQKEAA